jgi:hypothetical protein
MFNTIPECVPDWSNSCTVSNITTKNINDLLKYYEKLEQQEAKRKPKTYYQDNIKSKQQPESMMPRKPKTTQWKQLPQ